MMADSDSGLLAVDIGSSQVKLGWFAPAIPCVSDPHPSQLPISAPPLPEPTASFTVLHRGRGSEQWSGEIAAWLKQCLPPTLPPCAIASVHRDASDRLHDVLSSNGATAYRDIRSQDFNLAVHVANPDRVGVDRLLNALAVNRIRTTGRPAIIIDAGTAITVDLVAADGAFEGGAILPGLSMSLAALHSGTTTLPLMETESLSQPPDPVGKSTEEAMAAGVYWSVVGGIGRLVDLQVEYSQGPCDVFLTGGAAGSLIDALNDDRQPVRQIPHLTLAGIAIASAETDRT